MKKLKLSLGISIMLFFCGILLIVVLFYPIWRIELSAPQYPEGLAISINANGLGGDVPIINGLNHYIGMKTLHTEDFIEFTILPFLISFFAVFFLLVAIIRNRKLMIVLFFSFLLFGTLAMVDFWKWEYNYGHNLDPNAAIVVPGMVYQPPLIGYKQLLNFGAYSIPDIGGWLFILVGSLLLLCLIIAFKFKRKLLQLNNGLLTAIIFLTTILFSACNIQPQAIKVGSDNCSYCKMIIVDNRYGAEIITKKGKIFKFDELKCLQSAIIDGSIEVNKIEEFYFTDFCATHKLVKKEHCFLLKSKTLKAPMGGNTAVFSSKDSLLFYTKKLGGEQILENKLISIN